jgi:hypothetical protein
MLIQRNATTYEAAGLPATVVIGGRDEARVLPNTNISFPCGSGTERYWLNLNRTGAPACSAIAAEPTTNGIITEVGDAFSFDAQGRLKWDVVFAAHPGVYAWEWSVKHSPGVTFHHQPELTAEEIAEGHIRSADVVGSYAVYGDRSGRFVGRDGTVLADYGTGKLCHIYRPLFIDANGREAYGTLDITDGIMTVGMDAAWMDSAAYPVRLDPTLGYEATGASAIPLANSQHANWAYDETIAADITLQSGHIYCGSLSGGIGAFVIGLYSKGATLAASALLASSGSIALGSGSEFTWRSASMPGSVAANTPMVISCLETNTDGSVRSQYDTVSWGSGKSGSNATGAMLPTLSGLSDNSRQLSMYVTYEVAQAETIEATVAAVMPAPVVSATAEILDPVAATVAAALPAPVASVTAETLEPVECTVYAMLPAPLVTCTIEFDEPDEVQVIIAAGLPAPLVGIVAEVLEPLEVTVAAALPAPVASATADVLEPLTASVAAGLPSPVASVSGEILEPLECTVAAMLPAPQAQVVAGAEVVPVPPIVAQYIADWRAALNPATGGPGESVSITPVGGTQFTVPLAMVSRKGMVAPAELPREYAGRAGSWVVVRLLMDDLPKENGVPDVPPTDSLIMVDGRGHFIRCIQPLGPQGCGVRLYAVGDQWGRR